MLNCPGGGDAGCVHPRGDRFGIAGTRCFARDAREAEARRGSRGRTRKIWGAKPSAVAGLSTAYKE